jgi:hypothetical protein
MMVRGYLFCDICVFKYERIPIASGKKQREHVLGALDLVIWQWTKWSLLKVCIQMQTTRTK